MEQAVHSLLRATVSASHAEHPLDDDIALSSHVLHWSGLSSKIKITSNLINLTVAYRYESVQQGKQYIDRWKQFHC